MSYRVKFKEINFKYLIYFIIIFYNMSVLANNNWVYAGQTDDSVIYMSKENIKVLSIDNKFKPIKAQAILKTVYNSGIYSLMRTDFNCKDNTMKYVDAYFYDENDKIIKYFKFEDSEFQAFKIPPRTYGEKQITIACF